MRCRKRKGQAASEYLMTYGWSIVALIVVALTLYSLGIFRTTHGGPAVSGFTTLAPQSATIGYTSDAKFISIFLNKAGVPMQIHSISVIDKHGNTCTCTAEESTGNKVNCPAGSALADVTPTPLNDYAIALANENIVLACNDPDVGYGSAGVVDGDYTVDVTITYSTVVGKAISQHRTSGSISGVLE